jgi:molybdate transport system ATP-binding protein
VPAGGLLMHRRDRPSRGERENPVAGVITDLVKLGEEVNVAVQVDGAGGPPLFMTLPVHVAARNRVEVGARVGVSLLADRIHLMPWQDLGRVP